MLRLRVPVDGGLEIRWILGKAVGENLTEWNFSAKRRRGNEMPHQNPGLITVFAKRKPALSWPIEFEGLHWNVDMT